ncbi:Autophagy-related protein 2 [Elsinoe australis]|uniref:Autophagy-related protein 2 n=1 Tax=Elsinoe australis TaxID=40998 RepID=A0A2P7ZKD6_9PEZI|nr:Autophagy-related protein 2 [Elsinoe australis]
MASFLPSSIQKRLLRYALLKTGLLETQELDLESLDITLGRQNTVELRNVGLHTQKLSSLLELPPELRLEAARVLRLKLNVPADLYNGSITAEAHGIGCGLALHPAEEKEGRARGTESTKSPTHRKTHRRIGRSPPYDPGGHFEDEGVPTTQDLARSFLMEEPREEIETLKSRYERQNRAMKESIVSDTSEEDALGTGTAPGLPGFLAGFLQGIVDRFEFKVFDVTARLVVPLESGPATSISGASGQREEGRSVTAILKVESIDLGGIGSNTGESTRRHLSIENVAFCLHGLRATEGLLGQLSAAASQKSASPSTFLPSELPSGEVDMTESIYAAPVGRTPPHDPPATSLTLPVRHGEDVHEQNSHRDSPDPFDIRLGEDNLTWNFRRHESSSAASDIWSDSDQPADLAASVTADRYLAGSSRAGGSADFRSDQFSAQHDMTSEFPAVEPYQRGHSSTPKLGQGRQPKQLQANTASFASAPAQISPGPPRSASPPPPSSSSGGSLGDELMESRIYSEGEAESMFMSAYSTAPEHSQLQQSTQCHTSQPVQADELQGTSPSDSIDTLPAPQQPSDALYESQLLQGESDGQTADRYDQGVATPTVPQAQSRHLHVSRTDLEAGTNMSQLLLIDRVDIWIQSVDDAQGINDEVATTHETGRPSRLSMASSQAPNMPGAFSVYAEQSASVRFENPNLGRGQTQEDYSQRASVDIQVQNFHFAAEIGMISEYLAIGKGVGKAMSSDRAAQKSKVDPRPSEETRKSTDIKVKNFDASLVSSAVSYWNGVRDPALSSDATASLVSVRLQNTEASIAPSDSSSDWSLRIGKLELTVGDHKLLHFSDRLQESSMSFYQGEADIFVEASNTLTSITSKTVTQYSVQTKQLNFSLPFDKIEETFSSYGGLSTLLELSSSIASTDSNPRSSPPPSRKGVRFQDSPTIEPAHGAETKVNARIGGIAAVVSGAAASVKLTTSAVKAVARPEYIAAAIDNVQLLGPQVHRDPSVKPVEVVLNSLRFEYLFHPKDADLERLLSLITPSKNKYENDEDILIDTLLRQRRKGSVVRLTATALRIRVHDWKFVDSLQAFAEEMSSLSAVTKYLPEDERPGLLTLIRIQDAQTYLPVNSTFGDIKVTLQDVNVAQIGLPSLVAFSIGGIKASREGSPYLIHDFMPTSPNEDLPMIMARIIGDEVEPTLRLKFFNLCVEYSVPAFLALTELGQDVKAEQVIDLAASTVIDLTAAAEHNLVSPTSLASSSTKQSKKLSIDILFHDCMIGLQPEGISSKAMVALNNAKVTTEAPPKDSVKATIELRKSTVYVADEVESLPASSDVVKIAVPQRLQTTFDDMGYVSVCSIMSARVNLQITEDSDQVTKCVEVDVKNDLFLLETCADSTQTLIKTLGSLAPPMPPSKEDKFRVEAMSMDEMVSSFTGDAFEKPAGPPSTLFDMDTTDPIEDDDLLNASMSESVYGGLDALEDPGDDLIIQDETRGDTAESLLEEDPFEIPDNPNSAKLNNRDLIKTLNEQLTSNIQGGPVELKPLLLTDEQLDRLPGESTVLGAPYRWNTPKTQQPILVTPQSRQPLPFKLRVRDVHLIWNLYDGYDWQGTRQAISQAVEEIETRAEERRARRKTAVDPDDEESIIGDCLFNSIYIGVPANKDPNELRRQINRGIDDLASETESYATSGISKPTNMSGGSGQRPRRRPRRLKLERSKAHKIAFEAQGVSADVLVYPPGSGEAQSSVDLRVRDFDIFDNLPTSTWRKFMTSWHKNNEERELAKPMMHIELTTVRPVPTLSATELILIVAVAPIRLHVDQDALDFMTRFFEFKPSSAPPSSPTDQPFLQRVEVHTVEMCLDYKPKRVDYAGLRSGRYTEFKNFFMLDTAHVTLKHAILYGIQGFDPLHDTLNDIWMPDIQRNQLPGILSGLATVSPLVNLGTGFAEVVAVPIREYKKDGRVVRSIQKGAVHLVRNTTSEIARFGARVAVGTQNVLVGAETMLSPAQGGGRRGGRATGPVECGWTDVEEEEKEERQVSAYANQPLGVLQGLKSARRHLERDLLMARDAVIAVQGEVLDSGSASAAAQAVVRHAPTILLRPVIGASRAVGQTLMGAGNQFDRGNVRRIEDVKI